MRRRLAILAAGLGLLVLGWVTVFGPFLRAPAEDLISTPGLSGSSLHARQELRVPAGSRICTRNVVVAYPANRVRYIAAGRLRSLSGLRLTVSAPGFRAHGRRAQLMKAPPDTLITIPFSPQARTTHPEARTCLKIDDQRLSLVGIPAGTSILKADTDLDGRPTNTDIALNVLGSRELTRWEALRQVPDRISEATGMLSGPLIAALAVLVLIALIGIPLGALLSAQGHDRSVQG